MLTGFSVTDGVRVAEPAVAEGEGAGWSAAVAVDDKHLVVRAAVYLAAVLVPLLVVFATRSRSVSTALRLVLPTVHRSDRLRQ